MRVTGIRCLGYEIEGDCPRGRPKNTWKDVVDSDLKCLHLHASNAIDCKNEGDC